MAGPRRKRGKSRKAARSGRSPYARLAIASLTFVGLAALYGFANGQVGDRLSGLGAAVSDLAADAVGLTVNDVTVKGRRYTQTDEILAALGVTRGDSILEFDAHAARQRLLDLHWVREASVQRLFPDIIHVEIDEHEPFAIWRREEGAVLVDDRGAVVKGLTPEQFPGLPVIAGTGAPEAAPDFLAMLRRRPAINGRVVWSQRIGERRWTLRLDSGLDVHLPEERTEIALDELIRLHETTGLMDRDIAVIDMRLPDRITVLPRAADDKNAILMDDHRGPAAERGTRA